MTSPLPLTHGLLLVEHSPSLWVIKDGEIIRGSVGLEKDKTYNWRVHGCPIEARMKGISLSGGPGIEMQTVAAYSALVPLAQLGLLRKDA